MFFFGIAMSRLYHAQLILPGAFEERKLVTNYLDYRAFVRHERKRCAKAALCVAHLQQAVDHDPREGRSVMRVPATVRVHHAANYRTIRYGTLRGKDFFTPSAL